MEFKYAKLEWDDKVHYYELESAAEYSQLQHQMLILIINGYHFKVTPCYYKD